MLAEDTLILSRASGCEGRLRRHRYDQTFQRAFNNPALASASICVGCAVSRIWHSCGAVTAWPRPWFIPTRWKSGAGVRSPIDTLPAASPCNSSSPRMQAGLLFGPSGRFGEQSWPAASVRVHAYGISPQSGLAL